MKILSIVVLIAVWTNSMFAGEDSTSVKFRLLPPEHYVPVFTANATAHRISMAKLVDENKYFGSMGAVRPLLNATYKQWKVQISLAATYYVTLQKSTTINWQVIDGSFFVDFFFDVPIDTATVIRFGPGHTSQHLMDDAIEVLNYGKSVNYVRDYYQAFVFHRTNLIRGSVYGGMYYNYNFRIDSAKVPSVILEFGCEALNTRLAENLYFYTGFDIKLRGELNYGTSQNYQVGIKYENEEGRTVRIAYHYRTGLEERGQFFRQRNDWHTLGFYIDY